MIKLILGIFAIATIGFLAGCVPQTYTKTVTTTLDASGKVTGTVIEEKIVEPNEGSPRIKIPASGSVSLNNINK